MSVETIPFVFDGHNVRTAAIAGEVWFLATDVTDVLGFRNSRQAIASHVDPDDRDAVQILDSTGRLQRQRIINLYAVFSLILGSTLPDAKRFKRWVTHEVLPAIRKTGKYVPGEKIAVSIPFLLPEPKPRARVFPADFFKELFRLKGKPPVPPHKARWIAQDIINLIWMRVEDDIFPTIDLLNPTVPAKSSGKLYRKFTISQFVAPGQPTEKLAAFVARCCEAMAAFSRWQSFIEFWNRRYPIRRDLPHELAVRFADNSETMFSFMYELPTQTGKTKEGATK